MTDAYVLRSQSVLLRPGLRPADVLIDAGKIQDVAAFKAYGDEFVVVDVGQDTIVPGLVDTHVHLNEPGRAEWEGFASGTAAARSGGFTTLVDMPLNSSPVTTTLSNLAAKREAAEGKLSVDVGFHAGLIPANAHRIDELIRAGAIAAKAFMCPSGIDEFPCCGEADLRTGMQRLQSVGSTLLVHAEIARPVPAMKDPRRYADYLQSRPRDFERTAIEMMIRLVRDTQCPVHIVHLSDADCLPLIDQAKQAGLPITVETCPHYLYFAAEEIGDGRTDLKCAPPIREAENRERLWQGLASGLIDMVVSDHSPCTINLKQLDSGRFDLAWGGISSLQLGFSILWTEAHRRGFAIDDVVRWMSYEPAKLANLSHGIEIGCPAHIAIIDLQQSWTVDQSSLLHRNPVTPYHGCRLRGQVRETIVHGQRDAIVNGRLI